MAVSPCNYPLAVVYENPLASNTEPLPCIFPATSNELTPVFLVPLVPMEAIIFKFLGYDNNPINIYINDEGTTSAWWKQNQNGSTGSTSAPGGFSQRIPTWATTLIFQPEFRFMFLFRILQCCRFNSEVGSK